MRGAGAFLLASMVSLAGSPSLAGPAKAAVDKPGDVQPAGDTACRPGSKRVARTELYFGAGGAIPTKAWRRFLAEIVTPRFREGFTVLEGTGQWLGPHGLVREATHVLIVVYEAGPARDQALDEIRAAYKRRFNQQSVLRVDGWACASF